LNESLLTDEKLRFNILMDYIPSHPGKKVFKPGRGQYENVTSIIAAINRLKGFSALATLRWDKVASKTILKVKSTTPYCRINLGGFERHLGLKDAEFQHGHISQTGPAFTATTVVGTKPPDMTGGTHHFFIYCNLMKEVGVNEKMLQLVATVDATKGGYGEQIRHTIPHPIFVSCVGGNRQVIEVTIANDVGKCEGLLMGRTTLTFEKRRI
jgi:hypothetical protein